MQPLSQPNVVMCRYNEIAIKGRNRGRFEQLLMDGIRRALKDFPAIRFTRERGRLLCHHAGRRPFDSAELNIIRECLPRVFGLASFSPGMMVESQWPAIVDTIEATFPAHYEHVRRAVSGARVRYAARARRAWKLFPLSSHEIEVRLADRLLSAYTDLRVDLDAPQLSVGVEVRENWSFIFYAQLPGPGGLPSGSSSTALCLLSGGIDSPVASYLAMKRGCRLHFLTFHSHPYTPAETTAKVARLVRVLNRFQKDGRLLACNLAAAQKIIRDTCTERFRTILYRRLMLRVAGICADELAAEALVTGEAIGQVASQTVRNLTVINAATPHLVLRPLTTMDKIEVTDIARRIGTFAISEVACPDSCTVFSPRSPATSVPLARILADEQALDLRSMVRSCLEQTHFIAPSTQRTYPLEFDVERLDRYAL